MAKEMKSKRVPEQKSISNSSSLYLNILSVAIRIFYHLDRNIDLNRFSHVIVLEPIMFKKFEIKVESYYNLSDTLGYDEIDI